MVLAGKAAAEEEQRLRDKEEDDLSDEVGN
jgi:hypothetical protein